MSEPAQSSQSAEPDSAPDEPTSQPRKGVPLVAAAAIALAVGGLGLGAGYLWFGGSGSADSDDRIDRAESHIDYACQMMVRADRENLSMDDLGTVSEDPFFWEIPAAAQLLISAAILDPDQEVFHEAGRDALTNVQSLQLDDVVTQAVEACDGR